MEKITLAERGNVLSHGLAAGGQHVRGFAFKPWRTKDEKAVCEVRDKNRAITAAAFASEVLAHFLTEWCGVAFGPLKQSERRLHLAQALAGDVLHAWIQLRRQALGDDFEVPLSCRSCRTEFAYEIDLSTMEVNVAADGENLRRKVELRDGFEWRGQDVREVTVQPLRWTVYEGLNASLNTGTLKVRSIASAICELDGQPLLAPLPEHALDLTKWDLESVAATIENENLGPDLAIEDFCPQCGAKVRQSFPWTYDLFFSKTASGGGGA